MLEVVYLFFSSLRYRDSRLRGGLGRPPHKEWVPALRRAIGGLEFLFLFFQEKR